MELSERQRKILRTVVEEYVGSAEPVGSRTVLQKAALDCSPATVRSELAALSQAGYLEQPHTSAGRIPTAKGYRLYVNELMREREVSFEEAEAVRQALHGQPEHLEQLLDDAGTLASQLTRYPAISVTASAAATVKRFDLLFIDPNTFIIVLLLTGDTVKNKLVRLPFSFERNLLTRLSAVFNAAFVGLTASEMTPVLISSTERAAGDTLGLCSVIAQFAIETLESVGGVGANVSGGAELLKLPEFQDPDKAHKLLSYLSDTENLSALPALSGHGDVRVLIGPENAAEELKDASVILASYDAGEGMRGLIGVVGPTRMDYSGVAAKLSFIADTLSRLLAAGNAPPAGFGKLMLKKNDDKR